mmetsp:Transcript_94931/g.306467  ORF Transcript_94931/g.306467 Transcript_94931/m.306467 type:complete len:308 (-) Transcript_94931:1838-2761(-)
MCSFLARCSLWASPSLPLSAQPALPAKVCAHLQPCGSPGAGPRPQPAIPCGRPSWCSAGSGGILPWPCGPRAASRPCAPLASLPCSLSWPTQPPCASQIIPPQDATPQLVQPPNCPRHGQQLPRNITPPPRRQRAPAAATAQSPGWSTAGCWPHPGHLRTLWALPPPPGASQRGCHRRHTGNQRGAGATLAGCQAAPAQQTPSPPRHGLTPPEQQLWTAAASSPVPPRPPATPAPNASTPQSPRAIAPGGPAPRPRALPAAPPLRPPRLSADLPPTTSWACGATLPASPFSTASTSGLPHPAGPAPE